MCEGVARHGIADARGRVRPAPDARAGRRRGPRGLRSKIEELGVTGHTQKNTVAIVDGEDGTHRMQFADATHLDTDMIVFSAGIRPRDEIARISGLDVGARGGIVVDDSCRTSDADIYAIGECALWNGQV